MSKIYCSNLKCEHYNEKNNRCNNKEVILGYSNIATVNQGRKDVLECKTFRKSEEYERLELKVKQLMNIEE